MPNSGNKMKSPKYTIRVAIVMADEGPIKLIASLVRLEHKVYIRNRKIKAHHSAMVCLDVEGEQAKSLLLATLPYLVGKKRQALLALRLQKYKEENPQEKGGRSDRYIRECDAMYIAMRRRPITNSGIVTRSL
jgi:hypothetical protein